MITKEMTPLEVIIKEKIAKHGPIPMSNYIETCLADSNYGYYITSDPIGSSGDFITSPEISQVFGELIGLWIIMMWYSLKNPRKLSLVELGPGRGTLMADILRTIRIEPALCEAIEIHMVDINPHLLKRQQQTLFNYGNMFRINWHNSFDSLKISNSSIFIANEFFDAMPIHQYQKTTFGWEEVMVGLDDNNNLSLGTVGEVINPPPLPEALNAIAKEGDFYEFAPYINPFIKRISELFKVYNGAFLTIDYGYSSPTIGDSIQALKNHEIVSIFDSPGQSDITHHVDFSSLKNYATKYHLASSNIITQYEFLRNLGLHNRAEQILRNINNPVDAADFIKRVQRISDIHGMGTLFKVLAIASQGVEIAGFDQ